ncbi:hypothetical protein ACFLY6_00615 [Candidatus Dependentiae bacterium]
MKILKILFIFSLFVSCHVFADGVDTKNLIEGAIGKEDVSAAAHIIKAFFEQEASVEDKALVEQFTSNIEGLANHLREKKAALCVEGKDAWRILPQMSFDQFVFQILDNKFFKSPSELKDHKEKQESQGLGLTQSLDEIERDGRVDVRKEPLVEGGRKCALRGVSKFKVSQKAGLWQGDYTNTCGTYTLYHAKLLKGCRADAVINPSWAEIRSLEKDGPGDLRQSRDRNSLKNQMVKFGLKDDKGEFFFAEIPFLEANLYKYLKEPENVKTFFEGFFGEVQDLIKPIKHFRAGKPVTAAILEGGHWYAAKFIPTMSRDGKKVVDVEVVVVNSKGKSQDNPGDRRYSDGIAMIVFTLRYLDTNFREGLWECEFCARWNSQGIKSCAVCGCEKPEEQREKRKGIREKQREKNAERAKKELKRLKEEEEQKKKEAAIKIQKVCRGHLVRKKQEQENLAATKIQKVVRGRQTRKTAEKLRKKQESDRKAKEDAVVKIQRIARGYLVRKKQEQENLAATKIQKVVRGRQARKAAEKLRKKQESDRKAKEDAVVKIQRIARGYLVRKKQEQENLAATKIQKVVRGRQARKAAEKLRKQQEEAEKKRREEEARRKKEEAERKAREEQKKNKDAERKAAEEEDRKLKESREQLVTSIFTEAFKSSAGAGILVLGAYFGLMKAKKVLLSRLGRKPTKKELFKFVKRRIFKFKEPYFALSLLGGALCGVGIYKFVSSCVELKRLTGEAVVA